MLTDEEKLEIKLNNEEIVREARLNGATEEIILDDLRQNIEHVIELHKSKCFDPNCNIDERMDYATECVKEAFSKDLKRTEEPSLTEAGKQLIKVSAEYKTKQAIKDGLTEQECIDEMLKASAPVIERHKLECAANPCIMDESMEMTKKVIHDTYAANTTLTTNTVDDLFKKFYPEEEKKDGEGKDN